MNVLLIQTAFIGDAILCSPLIESLHRDGHTVGLVVKPEAAPLYEEDERISHVHIFDKRGKDGNTRGFFRISKQIAQNKYDAAVIPHRFLRSALLARFSGIPVRIGFAVSSGSLLFTHKVEYTKRLHEIERNHKLLQPLNITGVPPDPVIKYSNKDRENAELFLQESGINNSETIIGIGPGSKWFTKQWGEERYKRIVAQLTNNYDTHIVCFGGAEEQTMCERICAAGAKNTHNAAGKLHLRESAAALSKVSVVVTNDNGLMHLAVASGTHVVALFGPTVPEFGFSPWGDQHTIIAKDIYCRPCSIHGTGSCPEKHFRCMEDISSEEVVEKVFSNIQKS